MAEALGVPSAATENCLEQSQKADLIRVGRRGGGRGGIHLIPTELVNLPLGCAVELRNEVGRLVPKLRALKPVDHPHWMTTPFLSSEERPLRGCCFGMASIELDGYRDAVDTLPKVLTGAGWSGEGDARCYRVLPGASLGEALDLFVDYLSYPEAAPLRRSLQGAGTLSLHMAYDSTARVSLADHSRGGLLFDTFYQGDDFEFSQRPGLSRDVTITFKVLEVAADLWADSRAHLGINTFPFSPGGDPSPSRNENAETHPGKDEVSASATDRQSVKGAFPHTKRKAGDLNSPIGIACVCGNAMPPALAGWPLSQPPPMEAHNGRDRCTHFHP